MERIRIVWKDSNARDKKDIKYRKHHVSGYGGGWITDIEGDRNIYKNHYCALNAIDQALGDRGRKVGEKRAGYGIQIVGQKDDIA